MNDMNFCCSGASRSTRSSPGRAYVIHARNGGVGVAVVTNGRLSYRLHRQKLGQHFLFDEVDWEEGEPHGTAIPLRRLDTFPPYDHDLLLGWLAEHEQELRAEIDAAWRVVLGPPGFTRCFCVQQAR